MTLTKPRKLTWTKSLMVSPVFASTVLTTRCGPPRPYAALILFMPCPGMFTQESRGRLITVTWLRSPDTWISIIVSELELTAWPTCSAQLLVAGQPGALVHPGQQHVQRPARRGARGARR